MLVICTYRVMKVHEALFCFHTLFIQQVDLILLLITHQQCQARTKEVPLRLLRQGHIRLKILLVTRQLNHKLHHYSHLQHSSVKVRFLMTNYCPKKNLQCTRGMQLYQGNFSITTLIQKRLAFLPHLSVILSEGWWIGRQ